MEGEQVVSSSDRMPAEMTLVEIARELEQVTSRIEVERERERKARAAYREVAAEVEEKVRQIREVAQQLVVEQRRRMASFDGFLGRRGEDATGDEEEEARGREGAASGGPNEHQRSLGSAILKIWVSEKYRQPLTTDQIVVALKEVGYHSKAAPRSLKSALNQTLAKLCREGRIKKYRLDGQPIDPDETAARARRYMSTQG
jgi:hypothetical protein